MGFKKYFAVVVLLLFLVPVAHALSASIGNARMILRPVVEEGEITTIEKSIQVNNVNDIAVKITGTPSKEFEEIVTIINPEFEIQPGDSHNMDFIISLEYGGRYEGKINVAFAPADPEVKQSGVGLSSTIIIIAEGPENPNPPKKLDDDVPPPPEDDGSEDLVDEDPVDDPEDPIDIDPEDEDPVDDPDDDNSDSKANPVVGFVIIAVILGLGIGAFYLINRRGK
jgi:hypothetical protein